ncbi:MAG: PhoX family phosphatase [Acidimicrobiia bacterium]
MSVVDEPLNPTSEPAADAGLSRRLLLGGGAAAGLFAAVAGPITLGGSTAVAAPVRGRARDDGGRRDRGGRSGAGASSLGFAAVGASVDDAVTVPDGYVAQVLIPWGAPIQPDGPAFKFDGTNTAAEQAEQFGTAHDGMEFFPTSRNKGLLVVNHEALDSAVALFPTAPDYTDPETVLKAQNAHGVSVCELELHRGTWRLVQSSYARRITANTEMELTGPAAGHPALQTAADPSGRHVLGTVNNCAAGQTPWGTYLTCEENFNGYFGSESSVTPTPQMTRYGISRGGNQWWLADPRFDLAANPNEPNRFGWIVEIDPRDPSSTPKKRTALGRLKHENASFTEADDGRAVVYTGDDERFQFLYKFVSAQPRRSRHDHSPLDEGTLYVARFDADGSGAWLPLVEGAVPGYSSLAEILIDARGAAAAVGATPMDRPEWVAVHPLQRGVAYGTFTNNTARTTVDAANPRAANAFGHVLRWQNTGGDHGADGFVWSVFALAGAGLGTGDGSTIAPADAFGSPDGLAFDPDGRLWIQTDGAQPIACNNQMLAADPATGDIRRFLVGPKGCEITGWAMTADQQTLFVNIQHPGEAATDPADPAAQSNWPDFQGRPRSATVAIRRADGGTIGA